MTLRELTSSLKLEAAGPARRRRRVVVIDRLGRRPVLIGGFLVPEAWTPMRCSVSLPWCSPSTRSSTADR